MSPSTAFLRALNDLDRVLQENTERTKVMRRRIAQIQKARAAGKPFREIVDSGNDPLIVRLLTESGAALDRAGARVRRGEALALYEEGMTMEQIAEKFGVTRQRVSGLLKQARRDPL